MRPELIQARLDKLARLHELGVNPYPYAYRRTHACGEVLQDFDRRIEGEAVSLAGRISALRPMGKATFGHLEDSTGRIQLYLRRDDLGDTAYEVVSLLDLGDLIGVKGVPMRTRTGEATIKVQELTILSKTIAPLPVVKEREGHVFDAWEDVEARYRYRHLDLLLHPESRKVFEIRARTIQALRRFLDTRGFLEVETPILQPLYGGAMARPFTTFHNALGQTLFLRIAEELPLKKLLVGGIERVYEIGKVFRNEGMDKNHSPEYTLLEFYWAYADYLEAMDLVEEMIRGVALEATGKSKFLWRGQEIDLAKPFVRRSMVELVDAQTGLDVLAAPCEKLREFLHAREVEAPGFAERGHLIEAIFDCEVQPQLIQPTFVTDHPREISPLAKAHRKNPQQLTERFEIFIGAGEFGNAFSELNDPVDQRRRFEDQARQRAQGNEEAQVLDESFLRAMEQGMPPAAGVGIGVDRLCALLSEANSLRDVILFPPMRTKEGRSGEDEEDAGDEPDQENDRSGIQPA